MGFVYKITCTVTGKVYIGRTKRHYTARFAKHISSARSENPSSRLIAAAITEHGANAFICEPLFESDNIMLLDKREIEYIAEYCSTNADRGYNISAGGQFKHDDIIKRSLADATNMIASLDLRRKVLEVMGLPPYSNYNVSRTGLKVYVINNHPLCYHKCFSEHEYGSLEAAREAMLAFMRKIDDDGIKVQKMQQNGVYPTGIRPQANGYLVRKMLEGSDRTWYFGGLGISKDQSLAVAIDFNAQVSEIIANYKKSKSKNSKDKCSETKRLSAVDVLVIINQLYDQLKI